MARLTAGPNALRISGPNRWLALRRAMTQTDSPDPPERPYLLYLVMPSPMGGADLSDGSVTLNRRPPEGYAPHHNESSQTTHELPSVGFEFAGEIASGGRLSTNTIEALTTVLQLK